MNADITTGAGRGYRMRCLRDLRVEVAVDLDRKGPVEVVTDIDALSEAIARIAADGGFALRLTCEGGPSADAERVVEDCALELGAALGEALGARASGFRFSEAVTGSLRPRLAAIFDESLRRALRAGTQLRGGISRR